MTIMAAAATIMTIIIGGIGIDIGISVQGSRSIMCDPTRAAALAMSHS